MSGERGAETPWTRDYVAPELYDLQYTHYTRDIPFYLEQARAAGGPVLEVACGTGRIQLPLLQAGADADGFDLRPGMVEALNRKAAALGLKAGACQADMRDFTMPRRYALVIIPFRAFLHNLTTDDQLRTLRACREHLEPGGRLVLDVFYPSFSRLMEPDREWRLENEFAHPRSGAPLAVWSRADRDRVNQTMRVEMELRESDASGAVTARHLHGFGMRWIFKAEMELLLRTAGFARWEVAGGFDGRPLLRDSDDMIWTAWKD